MENIDLTKLQIGQDAPKSTSDPIDHRVLAQLCRAIHIVPEASLRIAMTQLILQDTSAAHTLLQLLGTDAKTQEKKLDQEKKAGQEKKADQEKKAEQEKKQARENALPEETCSLCKKKYDAKSQRVADECRYHPGQAVDVDIPLQPGEFIVGNDYYLNLYPEDYRWTCCGKDGAAEGCRTSTHMKATRRAI
ncbi:hypothetical protein BJ138DRAFT_1147440 [Hygrophoropsis aurantiaca]|uniref:Uncharacterized protein n=1 Tax=Hygrophoropsis aurantiaca TaxID=72124 RepID=A0ACB8AGY6_9AGAM|nr:hypothetical protein BJ138DRAFT_1147440 [Hygrophoropsis aurantiaca]